jgi:hypothetical protein
MADGSRASTRTPPPPGTPTLERRSKPRYPVKIEVYCQPITTSNSAELWWRAEVREVSLEGLGLISSRKYDPATYVCLELLDRRVPCRIAHIRPNPSGPGWLIGCAFLNELTKDDIDRMTKHHPPERT